MQKQAHNLLTQSTQISWAYARNFLLDRSTSCFMLIWANNMPIINRFADTHTQNVFASFIRWIFCPQPLSFKYGCFVDVFHFCFADTILYTIHIQLGDIYFVLFFFVCAVGFIRRKQIDGGWIMQTGHGFSHICHGIVPPSLSRPSRSFSPKIEIEIGHWSWVNERIDFVRFWFQPLHHFPWEMPATYFRSILTWLTLLY